MDSLDSFGEWLRGRRTALRLTRAELAGCAGCSVGALRKIEADERRPSRQLAVLLAECLRLPPEEHSKFIDAARGIRLVSRLGAPDPGSNGLLPTAGSAESSSGVRTPGTVWSLPSPATPTVGREAELAALAQLLGDPACRLLTLVGPGGIGKTRLAVEVACAEGQHYPDGVFFASLAATTSPDFIVPAIAQAVDLALSGSTDPRVQLLNHLRGKSALLLLDNLEHLLDGVDLVAALLAGAPDVKLLATSRERLGLSGEWVFEVQGLPVPDLEIEESPEVYGAVQLFLQRARQARADLALSTQDMPHVVRICHLVGGMPLAIELAATWVPTIGCGEIAGEIERGLDILSARLRDLPERHRSVRAVFDHSWHLLTDEEKRSLCQLAVFEGGFLREAALVVTGSGLPLLSALVAKSLVQRIGGDRYDFHPIVRQFARMRLSEDPCLEEAVRDRHCEYYLGLLRDQEGALKSAKQQETIQQLTKEIDNIRVAWSWAIHRKKLALLASAMRCFGLLFDVRGWSREGIEQVSLVFQGLGAVPENAEKQRALGQALSLQGMFHFRLGDHARALVNMEEGLALLRPSGEPALLVDALVLSGIIKYLIGEFDEAHDRLEEGLERARSSGDQWYTAYAQYNRGYIAGLSGRLDEGYEQMAEGIALWRRLGDPRFIALGLNFISPLAIRMGRLDEAQAFLEESLALSTQVGDRWGMGTAHRYLGLAALARGDTGEAEELITRSLAIFDGFVTGWDVVRSLVYLGEVKAAAGDTAGARQSYVETLPMAIEARALPQALDALVGLAKLDLAAGEAESAYMLSSFVMNHPATIHEGSERAGLLLARAEQQLADETMAALRAQAGSHSLESITAELQRAFHSIAL